MNMKILPYMLSRLGPDVQKVSEIGGEMTIQIPSKYSSEFKDFFADFDNDLDKLDIQSYGISITTLEQVFLKIGSMEDPSILFKKKKAQLQGNSENEGNNHSNPLINTTVQPLDPQV